MRIAGLRHHARNSASSKPRSRSGMGAGGQRLLVVATPAAGVLCWLLRKFIMRGGFLALIALVCPCSLVAGIVIGLPPPGTESKSKLQAATDPLNVAFVMKGALLDAAATCAHACHLSPNILTFSTMLAVMDMGYYILLGDTVIGLLLWLYYAFADELDGYVARKYNQCSKLGAVLDACTDVTSHTVLALATVCSQAGHAGRWQ